MAVCPAPAGAKVRWEWWALRMENIKSIKHSSAHGGSRQEAARIAVANLNTHGRLSGTVHALLCRACSGLRNTGRVVEGPIHSLRAGAMHQRIQQRQCPAQSIASGPLALGKAPALAI